MYIYPNSTIKLLRNISLTNDYDHTIYFTGRIAQSEFFLSKAKYTLDNQSYQRKERGYIQVNLNQNDLWDCTYLMFRNTSYNAKWFYAFITSVDYVNDNVSMIHYEIDVIQTWHFDYILDRCFVERQHSEYDDMFTNLIDENLDLGDDYKIYQTQSFDLTPSNLIMISNDNITASTDPDGVMEEVFFNSYFYPIHIRTFNLDGNIATAERRRLKYWVDLLKSEGQEQTIISISQYPSFIKAPISNSEYPDGRYFQTTESFTFTPYLTSIDGYTPRNKKLFNYPYNFLKITDHLGDSATYQWENWNADYLGRFEINGTIIGKPSVSAYPKYYKGITDNYDEGISINNFPENPLNGDAWKLWWAQNGQQYKTAQAIGAIKEAVGAIRSVVNPNPDALGGAESAADLFARVAMVDAFKKDLHHRPNQTYGQANENTLNMMCDRYELAFYQMTIKAQFARVIDQYFSRFGYASHEIKVPNRNARLNWTYVKTVGCEISYQNNSGVPSDDAVKIKSIYDRGITWWNNGNRVGDYGSGQEAFYNPTYSEVNT